MAQHSNRWAVHTIFFVGELPTQLGRDAEHPEEAGGHALLRHRCRALAGNEIHATAQARPGGNIDGRAGAFAERHPREAALRQVVFGDARALRSGA